MHESIYYSMCDAILFEGRAAAQDKEPEHSQRFAGRIPVMPEI